MAHQLAVEEKWTAAEIGHVPAEAELELFVREGQN